MFARGIGGQVVKLFIKALCWEVRWSGGMASCWEVKWSGGMGSCWSTALWKLDLNLVNSCGYPRGFLRQTCPLVVCLKFVVIGGEMCVVSEQWQWTFRNPWIVQSCPDFPCPFFLLSPQAKKGLNCHLCPNSMGLVLLRHKASHWFQAISCCFMRSLPWRRLVTKWPVIYVGFSPKFR